ncbi:glycosyltransferase [Hymenobacter tibetensis]|uniref:Glycosyltransferase n=1 Tax=Hymenobacter tibetensis TaxID=497967 RepID=A0ABY4CRV3_9BACT|nr:glycosyltransferase [Hymenobacter tibetensis]UOG72995.1 glycosyltransferase [Hymenobacter tibetensis]
MHFTVITPTHNRRQFLPEAIASVRATITAPLDIHYEHLILENASTDDTADWLRTTDQKGEALRVISQQTKLQPGPARNILIRETPADSWLVPLDDDDVLLQRCLYHYADLVQRHPDQPWFVADFLRVDEERRYLPSEDYYAWRFDSAADMLKAIFKAEHFIQGNVCYSRSLFEKVGGYDEEIEMAEDLDLYVRFLLAGHLPILSPHISHLHRFHTSNVSIGVDADKHGADLRVIYDKYAEQLQAVGVERPG